MLSNLNLKINNIGPVNEVDMGIGKINVIGGLNATGKSTVSKLIYCILKGNVVNRQKFAYSLVLPSIKEFVRFSSKYKAHNGKLSEEELFDIYNDLKYYIHKDKDKMESWSSEFLNNQIKKIDQQMEVIEKNDEDLYISILKRVLSSEFNSFSINGSFEFRGTYNEMSFDYSIDLKNTHVTNSFIKGFFSLSDVNYMDSMSLFDIEQFKLPFNRKIERINHLVSNLKDNSESLEFLDDQFNEKIIKVEEKINNLIDGKFESKKGQFIFISNEGHETFMGDTSSGIKQIGIIQILLANRKLKEHSFLIIDEPEVNLHPEWQIKLAEILCILAKDLNVYIYINTHSPMFIEAMSVFSEYYYLQDEANFYLTKKQGKGFTFEKIANDDMGAVYENLSRPYDDLDEIKADILFRD